VSSNFKVGQMGFFEPNQNNTPPKKRKRKKKKKKKRKGIFLSHLYPPKIK
jgi:hypothetical protein